MRHAAAAVVPLAAAAALVAGCAGHGKYTQAFLDESKQDMLRLRAAMHYDTAAQQFESGDLGLALASVNDSVRMDPNNAEGYLLRGRILLETGRAQAALAALEHGAALDPGSAKYAYYRALACERLDRPEQALEAYALASTLDPNDPSYRLAAAEMLADLGRLGEARELLEQDAGEFETHPAFRQMLGHVALLAGDAEAAVRYFIEATVLKPDDRVLREDLCNAQIAAGQFASAEATLRRLAEDGKAFAKRRDLQHLHAACLLVLERPIEARGILHSIVHSEAGATDIDAWVKLIDVALMLGDDGQLKTVAYRLMTLAPSRPEGYLAMALWQRRAGDPEGALRSLDRAIKRAPDDENPRRLHALITRELDAAASG